MKVCGVAAAAAGRKINQFGGARRFSFVLMMRWLLVSAWWSYLSSNEDPTETRRNRLEMVPSPAADFLLLRPADRSSSCPAEIKEENARQQTMAGGSC